MVSVLEVSDDDDEVVEDGPLMSVVTGGLVLVMVAVVVRTAWVSMIVLNSAGSAIWNVAARATLSPRKIHGRILPSQFRRIL